MKNMTLFLLLVLGVAILTCSCSKDEETPVDPTQQVIDEAVLATRTAVESEIGRPVPNLNIYIQTPAGAWFSSSAGSGYLPITPDTYFRFASNTKNFTAAAALNMMQDGWLDLDAKITDTIPGGDIPYVPVDAEWKIPFKDQITIRMLLNHSAGVYDVDNDSVPGCMGASYTAYTQYLDPNHQFTATEMVNQLVIHNLYYFEPGTGKHYSNTGYAIIGEIIGRIYSNHTGLQKHLTDYLDDYVTGPTTPVPMDIFFPYLATDQDLPFPYSCGHVYEPDNITHEFCSYNMSAQVAEGNGYTTMRNLHTWIRTLMKGENILTPASVELMKTASSTADPHYGLGCFYMQNLGYGHNGARVGNMSLIVYDPLTDVSIVTYISLINNPDFMPTYYAITDVAYAVRAALGFPGKP